MPRCCQVTASVATSPQWQLWSLVLQRLSPRELAKVALVSLGFSSLVRAITALQSADAARGLEALGRVPYVNAVDNQRYAAFQYSVGCVMNGGPVMHFRGSGCQCCEKKHHSASRVIKSSHSDCASTADCSCGTGVGGCKELGQDGRLLALATGNPKGSAPAFVFECGSCCRCSADCPYRASQGGIAVKLRVVRHRLKGWGLHAGEAIPPGKFVCEYAGELITTVEAKKRQAAYDKLLQQWSQSSEQKPPPPQSLLVVREHLPSGKSCLRINIDPDKIGNVARFLNHSCDGGNLEMVLVRSRDSPLPRVAMFAKRAIEEGEELTMSYGDVGGASGSIGPSMLAACFCGATICSGRLPRET